MQLGNEVRGIGMQVMSDGQIYLSVANPTWKLTPQTSIPTRYSVDGSLTWVGDALAVTPNILVIILPTSSDPVETLARGKSFATTVESGPLTFDLSGAGAARDMLKTCLAKKDGF